MYEQKTIAMTCRETSGDLEKGLTNDTAQLRLKEMGQNLLVEKKSKSKPEMFLAQLNEPLIFVLFIAGAISMLLREFSDTVIIMIVILVNAFIGVIQEGKAQKALAALKKLTSPHALVKRDNKWKKIPAADLVVGDLIRLEAGSLVPADIRLVYSVQLTIEESALTGESVPTHKDAGFLAHKNLPIGDCANMAFMTTTVTAGRGEGIVIGTGMKTEIGKIASLINNIPDESTPLQKRLGDLGKLLSIVAVILCVALFLIAVLQKRDMLEMLITAISLAVAAVPEGLPAIVTIVLALGVQRLVKVNTIVRRLPSVETLGAVSIVCSDKTGTLTQNRMTVIQCYTGDLLLKPQNLNYVNHKDFIDGFVLCNDASIENQTRLGDPTELALIDLGLHCSIKKEKLTASLPRVNELAFDSKRKMMTTLHRQGSSYVSYTKGAADVIINRCTHIMLNQRAVPITEQHKNKIRRTIDQMAADALRVLALAKRVGTSSLEEKNLTFVGLVGMLDPIRPEALAAVKTFKMAQVKTVMITGDHIDTAFAIARQLGIADKKEACMTGAQLDQLNDTQLASAIQKLSVFARVSPEHKVRIVNAYRSLGNIVSMTGDGVNDAPSLKAADIGVAMGITGTDVAKNASDIILTDDNFATIEKAIEEGRGIYENIKKSILFLLSSNFGEIITMFLAVLMGLPAPLKAIHILWINLITDSLPALALGVDRNNTHEIMSKAPRNPKESLFAGGGLSCTIFYGVLIAGISLLAFFTVPYAYLVQNQMSITLENVAHVLAAPKLLNQAQTYAFTVLGVSQLFHAIGMRDVNISFFKMKWDNKLMFFAFIGGLLLQISVTEIPYLVTIFGTTRLAFSEWARLIFLSAMPLFVHEVIVLTSGKIKLPFMHKEKISDPFGSNI